MRKFTFNPIATPNGGTLKTQIPGGSALRFVIMNFSPANLSLQFAQGYTAACASQDRRLFEMHNVNNGNISWTIDSYTGSIVAGLSLVVVEVYEASERIPEVYPSPVPSLAPPNLQLFSQSKAATQQISLTIPVVTGMLFYVIKVEYTAGVAAADDARSLTLTHGQVLSQIAYTLLYSLYQAAATTKEFFYSLPTPYQQAAAGTGITAIVSATGSTPAHDLNIWGYYL